MDNTEKLLLQILQAQNKTNERLDYMESAIKDLKSDVNSLKSKVDRIETKLDTVYNQTVRTCEDVAAIKTAVVKGEEAYNYFQGIKDVLFPKG